MLLVRFVKDCKAGVAPLLALGIIPLLGSVGAAVDYGRANAVRAAMQSALDATALMLAKESQNPSGGQFALMGTDFFNANFARPEVQNVAVQISSSPGGAGSSLTLSATGSVKTAFMGLIGLSQINLSITSGTYAYSDGLGCVLSLDPHASGAANGQGSTTVNLGGCSLYDNSDDTTALVVGGRQDFQRFLWVSSAAFPAARTSPHSRVLRPVPDQSQTRMRRTHFRISPAAPNETMLARKPKQSAQASTAAE
jgi:Flp pilus assembly protein TadG